MSDSSSPVEGAAHASAESAAGPLAGIRVLELAAVIMGPYAGQLLGDLGADVIKVEHGVIDSSRVMGGGPDPELSGIALNLHRNKRSVGLDVKTPEGHEVLLQLLATCDVFITNIRPASLARLGLTYEDLAPSMPRLVYCQSQGFATGSDDEDRPAYDDIIQAMTGLPWLNQEVLGQTAFMPTLIGDKVVGLTIAYGVLAASGSSHVRRGVVFQSGGASESGGHSRWPGGIQPDHVVAARSAPHSQWLRRDHAVYGRQLDGAVRRGRSDGSPGTPVVCQPQESSTPSRPSLRRPGRDRRGAHNRRVARDMREARYPGQRGSVT